MRFEIQPHVGAGPLTFGIPPQQVRALVGGEFTSGMQNEFATYPRDYFLELGVFADYDMSEKLEAIELAKPAEAIVNRTDLLKLNFRQAIAFMKARDPRTTVEIDGATSNELGLAIWAPAGDEGGEDPIETVLVFRDGYYDKLGAPI